MRNIKNFVWILVVGVHSLLTAQTILQKQLSEANAYFEKNNFLKALPIYYSIYNSDTLNYEVNLKLGICIFETDTAKFSALNYFNRALNKYPIADYFKGRIYHQYGYFDSAIMCYNKYKSLLQNNNISLLSANINPQTLERINYYISQSITARELMMAKKNAVITNMGSFVNTAYSDMFPIISEDEKLLLFSSNRSQSTGGLKNENEMYFFDVYLSAYKNNAWQAANNIGTIINSNYDDVAIALSSDATELLLYKTDSKNNVMVYFSEYINGAWTVPQLIKGDISSIAFSPACFSSDKSELYFASNRAGGYGGYDIYKSIRLPNGTWAKAVNLGPFVNTKYDELSPFLQSNDVTLYFSSNRANSMGGFDIFKSELDETDQWTEPENIGFPINSVYNETHFVLTNDTKKAYYTSDRKGGFGGYDIYEIIMPIIISNYIFIRGTIFTNEPVYTKLSASITITNSETDEVIGVYNSQKKTGKYMLVLSPGKVYKMLIEADDYQSYETKIDLSKELRLEDLFKNIILKSIKNK